MSFGKKSFFLNFQTALNSWHSADGSIGLEIKQPWQQYNCYLLNYWKLHLLPAHLLADILHFLNLYLNSQTLNFLFTKITSEKNDHSMFSIWIRNEDQHNDSFPKVIKNILSINRRGSVFLLTLQKLEGIELFPPKREVALICKLFQTSLDKSNSRLNQSEALLLQRQKTWTISYWAKIVGVTSIVWSGIGNIPSTHTRKNQ